MKKAIILFLIGCFLLILSFIIIEFNKWLVLGSNSNSDIPRNYESVNLLITYIMFLYDFSRFLKFSGLILCFIGGIWYIVIKNSNGKK